MKRKVLLATGAVFLLTASSGLCKSIKKHEAKQERRIDRGIEKGKLTPKEASRLENQQENIDRERAEAMEDGKISRRERKDIRHDQKRLGQDIRNKKHNERNVRH